MSENKENEVKDYEVKKKGPHRDPFRRAGSVVIIDNTEFIVIKPHGNGRWWLINKQGTEARLLRDFQGCKMDLQALQNLAPMLTSFPIYQRTRSQVKQKNGRRRGGSRIRRPLSPLTYPNTLLNSSTTTPTPSISTSSNTLAFPSSPSSPLSPSLPSSHQTLISGSTSSRSLSSQSTNKRKTVSDDYQPPSLLSDQNTIINTNTNDSITLSLTQQLALLQQQLAESQKREQFALYLQQQEKKEKEELKKEFEEIKKENEEIKKEKEEVEEKAKKLQKKLTAVEFEAEQRGLGLTASSSATDGESTIIQSSSYDDDDDDDNDTQSHYGGGEARYYDNEDVFVESEEEEKEQESDLRPDVTGGGKRDKFGIIHFIPNGSQ